MILPSAVVLGMSATGLAIARSLGPRGIRVYGLDFRTWEVGYKSRWVKTLPFSRLSPDKRLAERLLEWSRTLEKPPVLFPAGDPYVRFLGEFYGVLKDYFTFLPGDPAFAGERILSKENFYRLCQEKGVLIPETFFPQDEEQLFDIEVKFPVILKPRFSHLARQVLHGEKVIVVRNKEELVKAWRAYSSRVGGFIVQRLVFGPEENIWTVAMYVDREGNTAAWLTGQKLRQYPVDFGSATLFRTKTNEELAQLAMDVNLRLGLKGIVSHEYKRDPVTGSYYMIEINPRVSLWWGVCKKAGVDLIWRAYADTVGLPVEPINQQKDGVVWQYLIRDIAAVGKRKKNLKTSVLKGLFEPKDVYAVMDVRDPFPGMWCPVQAGIQAWQILTKK